MMIKEWLTGLAPIASALAAVTAIGVSLWVANAQRQIQRRQVQQNLFDKRYDVFLAVEEFLMYVVRTDGSFNLLGDEFRRFKYAAEQAEFVFDSDVVNYMKGINQTVVNLYPRCVERDHLAKMGKNIVALSAEITPVLGDLAGSVLQDRKRVFWPYLQVSRSSAAEGSEVLMKLNGWQRLWVLVAALWLLPVVVLSYGLWPRASDISKADVYARMKSDDGRRLVDYYDTLAAQFQSASAGPWQKYAGPEAGSTTAPAVDISAGLVPKQSRATLDRAERQRAPGAAKTVPIPQGATLEPVQGHSTRRRPEDWFAANSPQGRRPKTGQFSAADVDQPLAGEAAAAAEKVGPNASPVTITPDADTAAKWTPVSEGLSVNVDGQVLQFVTGVSDKDAIKTTNAYHVAMRHVLELKRTAFIGEILASWLVPVGALYALGWAIGWVRRGFTGPG